MEAATDFDEFRRAFGDEATREAINRARPVEVEPLKISATPYECRDPRHIPLRPWVYGRQLLRGSLSLVVAPGATGKTALLAGTALALASGRSLLDKQVWDGPKRVWLWNLEDSLEELARLIEAARLHWNISPAELDGRLFVDSALNGSELMVAVEDRSGFRILRPVVDALVTELIERGIDVLIIDPFVSSHRVSENDNGAIDAIAKEWARVGVRANCSVVLVHHTGKLGGAEATAERARGASALVGAARSVLALNKMTEEEGRQFGIDGEQRRRYVRAYDDKNNRTPPAEACDWYQLASVSLGNGIMGGEGDSLPVMLPWSPPDAFDGVTVAHLQEVQQRIGSGQYRKDPQSSDWVGLLIAEVLGLDVTDRKGSDAARVKRLQSRWEANKALLPVRGKDHKGNERVFLEAGEIALEGSTP
ncbi:MAG TPA: AAA family ATPase [Allosphingosinicella sp.]|jgi:hypothetical protein|uniref:AAA family ATPase n=1 Tax=Allosphingosinicella sp. TaxID=2823234 RepID=UPI002F28AE89